MTPEEYLEGQVLLIDKPLKWSSFQAVNKLKYLLINKVGLPKKFKIGHAGTLDPLATGLLLICTGKFTKKFLNFKVRQKNIREHFISEPLLHRTIWKPKSTRLFQQNILMKL